MSNRPTSLCDAADELLPGNCYQDSSNRKNKKQITKTKTLLSRKAYTYLILYNAGDALTRHNGMKFSTKDQDNDIDSSDSCSQKYKGAWWYEHCHYANLNGLYLDGEFDEIATGVVWHPWRGYYFSLKTTEMKLRPVQTP